MRVDLGLDVAVGEFVRALTPVLEGVVAALPNGDPATVGGDVLLEAFNLACAFIDADGLATDEELWALLRTFVVLEPSFASTTPAQARQAGLTRGKRAWLDHPSTMFDILVGVDRRDGTSYSTTYYEHAMAIGHMVASLDAHTSRTELLAIEDLRSRLLSAITGREPSTPADGPAPPSAPTAGSPPGPPASGPAPAASDPPPGAAAAGSAAAGRTAAAPTEEIELPPPRPLPELLAELDALVGMAEVKREVRLVADLLQVQKLREERKLPVIDSSRHLVFTGNPGTGKTTVARLLAQIYRTLDVVEKGQLVETDRSGLVAGFVGQTATRVVEAFDRADGGVLLIDEAYALVRGGERDFGREAIDTIVKLVEDRRDRLVVIAAGYPDEMDGFLDANPGLRSRFPKTIAFPDYATDELLTIFTQLGARNHYACDPAAEARVRVWLDAQPRVKGFGNGRLARNLFEEAVARQASRLVRISNPTDEQLVTLTADDIPGPDEGPVVDQADTPMR